MFNIQDVARENNDLHHSYFEPLYDAYMIKNVAPMLKRKKKSLPNANSNDLHTAQLTTKCTLKTIHILRQQKERVGGFKNKIRQFLLTFRTVFNSA